jgi:hypothetical protein
MQFERLCAASKYGGVQFPPVVLSGAHQYLHTNT